MQPTKNKRPDDTRSTKGPKTGESAAGDAKKSGAIQGEGNWEAAREFNAAERKFVESGKVDAAARAASPRSDAEAQEMLAAEREGKSRAKGEDPAVSRPKSSHK